MPTLADFITTDIYVLYIKLYLQLLLKFSETCGLAAMTRRPAKKKMNIRLTHFTTDCTTVVAHAYTYIYKK